MDVEYILYIKKIILIVSSYLIGCFNTGYYLISFLYKKDIRTIGSYSTGATNVSRVCGKKGFMVTFLGDSMKGLLTIEVCKYLQVENIVVALCFLFVIIGHVFPVQLNFKGGKGIAVSIGALIAFDYHLIIGLFLCFAIVMMILRNYQMSGLVAFILLPIEALGTGKSLVTIVTFFLVAWIVIYSHKKNIQDYIRK